MPRSRSTTLQSERTRRRALAAELDAGSVDRPAHDAVERVDLAYRMPLAKPADRWVARHLADCRPPVGQQ
jgi:hypothetical protein